MFYKTETVEETGSTIDDTSLEASPTDDFGELIKRRKKLTLNLI